MGYCSLLGGILCLLPTMAYLFYTTPPACLTLRARAYTFTYAPAAALPRFASTRHALQPLNTQTLPSSTYLSQCSMVCSILQNMRHGMGLGLATFLNKNRHCCLRHGTNIRCFISSVAGSVVCILNVHLPHLIPHISGIPSLPSPLPCSPTLLPTLGPPLLPAPFLRQTAHNAAWALLLCAFCRAFCGRHVFVLFAACACHHLWHVVDREHGQNKTKHVRVYLYT